MAHKPDTPYMQHTATETIDVVDTGVLHSHAHVVGRLAATSNWPARIRLRKWVDTICCVCCRVYRLAVIKNA